MCKSKSHQSPFRVAVRVGRIYHLNYTSVAVTKQHDQGLTRIRGSKGESLVVGEAWQQAAQEGHRESTL